MVFINIDIATNIIKFNIYNLINNKRKAILKDKIIIPKSFDTGSRLSYIRSMIKMLIDQYDVKKAYLNTQDGKGTDIIKFIKQEGVIEELLSNSGVEICK